MSETGNSIRRHYRNIRSNIERTLHGLNETKKNTTSELKAIERIAYQVFAEKNSPKILTISTEKDEYVSIRRIEGSKLDIKLNVANKIENSYMDTTIPSRLLPDDGMIGILVTSQTFAAEPRNKNDIEFINEKTDYDEEDGWSHFCKLQYFLMDGGIFNKESWDFTQSPIDIRLIKKVGNKFYLLTNEMVEEIQPDEKGNFTFIHWGFYWSEGEIEVQEDLNDRFEVFYALMKGSSETETKRSKKETEQKLASQSARN